MNSVICKKTFSVIVPVWRGDLNSLSRLLDSIPERDDIEVIIVDNSKDPIMREEIVNSHSFVLLHSDPKRHAGGSRNEGVLRAKGDWLLFADSDDFFTKDAFDYFMSYRDSDIDIIYYCCKGISLETGERSKRGDNYNTLIHKYLNNEIDEWTLRFGFVVPWAKMIKKELVLDNKIQFDEIVAANDAFFSVKTGYYANSIIVDDKVVYVVTDSKNSLTKRVDKESVECRFVVGLRINQFMKQHGFAFRQVSLMRLLKRSLSYGPAFTCHFLYLMLQFRQNPFAGWKNWFKK